MRFSSTIYGRHEAQRWDTTDITRLINSRGLMILELLQKSQVCWKPRCSLDIGRLEPPPCAVTNREHPDRLSALIDFIYDPVHVRFLAIEQVPQFPS
jgi:hypothetical protein